MGCVCSLTVVFLFAFKFVSVSESVFSVSLAMTCLGLHIYLVDSNQKIIMVISNQDSLAVTNLTTIVIYRPMSWWLVKP